MLIAFLNKNLIFNEAGNFGQNNLYNISHICRFYVSTAVVSTDSPNDEDTPALDNLPMTSDDKSDDVNSLREKMVRLEDEYKNEFSKISSNLIEITKFVNDIKLSNNNNSSSTDNNNDRLVISHQSQIMDETSIQQIDFILISNSSQLEVNTIFQFESNKNSRFVSPDKDLSHLKFAINKELLVNISYLTFRLMMWDKIYSLYFKSIFKIISKLRPISNKYFQDLNTIIISQDSLRSTPAISMMHKYKDTVAKVIYGYANGLHDMIPFIHTKYHKINIDYQFKTIPLITRGDWGHKDSSSLIVTTSYINDNFVKFNLNDSFSKIQTFVNDILCVSKDFYLGDVFKRSTKITKDCPELFSRFILWQEDTFDYNDSSICDKEISYLEQNNLDE